MKYLQLTGQRWIDEGSEWDPESVWHIRQKRSNASFWLTAGKSTSLALLYIKVSFSILETADNSRHFTMLSGHDLIHVPSRIIIRHV